MTFTDASHFRDRGVRIAGFGFDLLDEDLLVIGELPVVAERPAVIQNNINRTIKRTLTGLVLPPSVTPEIDPFHTRVRPSMILGDGTRWPLGIFMWADAVRSRERFGSAQYVVPGDRLRTDATLTDQAALLDFETDRGLTARPGSAVATVLDEMLTLSPLTDWDIDPTGAQIRGSDAVSWPPGTRFVQIINDLCQMAGFFSVWFDNHGRAKLTTRTDATNDTEPDFAYGPGTANVIAGTITENDSTWDAPNRFIVANTALTDEPVVGRWDVPPAEPHSIANRNGQIVTDFFEAQGVATVSQARTMARQRGQEHRALRWVTFDAVADPRHDTWAVVRWLGNNYREQSWEMALAHDSPMRHNLRRTVVADEDVIEEDPDDDPPEGEGPA